MRRHRRSTGAWNTMPTSDTGPATGRPATSTRPVVAGRSPATMRSRVDLPQPEGPTRATSSPRSTASAMSRNASTGPDDTAYVMPTRSRRITSARSAPRRIDPREVLARPRLVALDLARHVGHVGVDELDGAAHLAA